MAIEDLFKAACPVDIFRSVLLPSRRVDELLENPAIRAVSFTGSSAAGRSVAAKAGSLLKKAVLELGGSDAYIILEDANIEAAATICTAARMINSGQSCIAGKRFIAVEAIFRQFEEAFVERMAAVTFDHPLLDGEHYGPLARFDLRNELHRQVEQSISQGARLLLGGKVPPGPGAFYSATVLTEVQPGMVAAEEELFGPVAAVCRARDESDAIKQANATPFGLGAAIFTQNGARGERIACHELEAGSCFVNDYVRSDSRLAVRRNQGVRIRTRIVEFRPAGIHECKNDLPEIKIIEQA